MNIKSIPASQSVNAVKDTAEEGRQPPNRDAKSGKDEKRTKATEATEVKSESLSPEAGDDSLRQSQKVDSQTLVELLNHIPKLPSRAKFPTPPKVDAAAASVKKPNRSV